MSVVPPSFPELVATADTIVRGEVTDVHSEAVAMPQGQAILTFVTLHVERTLKGTPADTLVLKLLGGTVGQRSLRVAGMPAFKVGERGIFFLAENGQVLCPLVSAGHGRYRLLRDAAAGRDYVARDNGSPLESPDEVELPLAQVAVRAAQKSPDRALSPADFEGRISRQLEIERVTPTAKLP